MRKSNAGPYIWTAENRAFLFKYLCTLFGPYKSWGKPDKGGSLKPTGHEKEYDQALRDLATYFSQISGHTITPEAVDQQKKWGCTLQPEITNQGHCRTWVVNRTAAYDAGFVVQMPKHLVIGFK